jgi:hypothetical protein
MEQEYAPGHELIMPDRGALPIIGRKVIFARVHLRRNSRIWPPAINDGDKGAAIEQPRVENGHRQSGPLEQDPKFRLGHRSDAIADFG